MQELANIKLIVGLGNPDKKYQNTYHNAGFFFIDFLAKRHPRLAAKTIKSTVSMNRSGEFIEKELKKRTLKAEKVLIVHDDADIQLGHFKLSFNRNSAGHKGIQSIINRLKTKKFWRLRIGIRPSTASPQKVKAGDFVLKPITPSNKKKLEEAFKKASALF